MRCGKPEGSKNDTRFTTLTFNSTTYINYLFTILCCSIFQCFCKEESSFFLAKNDLKCVLLVSKGETLMVVNLEVFNQLQNLDFWSNKISEENLVKRFSIQNILQGKLTYHKYIPYQYRSTYLKFYRVLYWLYDSFLVFWLLFWFWLYAANAPMQICYFCA